MNGNKIILRGRKFTSQPVRPWDISDPLAPMFYMNGKRFETAKAHRGLLDYAQLGAMRSLARLHEHYTESTTESPTLSLDTIATWSVRYDWMARTARWDVIQADLEIDAWENRRRALKELDWNMGSDLRMVIADLLEAMPKFVRRSESEKTDVLEDGTQVITKVVTVELGASLSQIALALKRASELQRLAADLPTESIQLSGAALDDQIRAELDKLVNARKEGVAGPSEGNDDSGDHDSEL